MEHKTHYEKVIGGNEEEKQAALQELQKWFETKSESLSEYELEKTEVDKKIINDTTAIVDEMIKEYGGNPKALPLEKIHILKPDSVEKITEGRLFEAIHYPLGQDIGVEKRPSLFDLASGVAHELFHLKSYKSARVGESREDVRLYRSGISMIDRKTAAEAGEEKEYFGVLEEAIVAECTKKFLEKADKIALLRDEIQAIKQIKKWVISYFTSKGASKEKIEIIEKELKYLPDVQERVNEILSYSEDESVRAAYASGMLERLVEEKEYEGLERYEERKKLYQLLDEILAKSNGIFKNRDELFQKFAEANFSGNYFKIARIVENALGKGAFRKLAEGFSVKS